MTGRKAKGFKAKYGVGLLTMNAFLRAAGVRTSGVKIPQRIEKAFEKLGRPVYGDRSVAEHCMFNVAFIHEKARGNFKPAHRPSPAPVAGGDVTGDDFLGTFAWRKLRMQVLRHYGARCMCCGATPDTGSVMNVDHIKPRKTHPHLALDFDNLQVLCGECNHGKGNWDTTDWRPQEERIEPEVASFIRSLAAER